jgi:hypothetical protein
VPVLLLFSAAALERAAARWPSRVGNAPVALLCALSLAYAAAKGVRFDDAPEQRVAGAWLARSGWPPEVGAAGARPAVMARKPWVAYYAGADMLELPEAPLEEVLELAATRAADVLVADARSVRESRPALAPLLPVSAAPPGLRPLHAVGGEKPIVLWDARGLSRR